LLQNPSIFSEEEISQHNLAIGQLYSVVEQNMQNKQEKMNLLKVFLRQKSLSKSSIKVSNHLAPPEVRAQSQRSKSLFQMEAAT